MNSYGLTLICLSCLLYPVVSVSTLPVLNIGHNRTANLQSWPALPYSTRMSTTTTLVVDKYGRHVCVGDASCQISIRDDITEIAPKITRHYRPQPYQLDIYQSGAVKLMIVQWVQTDKRYILHAVDALEWLMADYGTTELYGAIEQRGHLLARYELVFEAVSAIRANTTDPNNEKSQLTARVRKALRG